MSRWLALAEAPANASMPGDSSTKPDKTQSEAENPGFVTFSRMSPQSQKGIDELFPNIEEFEERAAISEYDGALSRVDAGALAAECQGFDNVIVFRAEIPRDDQT